MEITVPYRDAKPAVEIALSIGVWSIAEHALPDTGFDGQVIIPFELMEEIPVLPRSGKQLLDAWGGDHSVLAWEGELQLGDRIFPVEIVATGSQFLLGRGVLDQLEVCFEFGERVRLRFEREGSE